MDNNNFDTLSTRLQPGDPAPEAEVIDAQGQAVALSSLWARGPVLLTFLRHFG
jgi:peroxiredoxin